jgi:ABC-2 type transport system permease protein
MIRTTTLARRATIRTPILAYLRLELRRRLRDRRYLVLSAAFPIVLYLVYTGVITAQAGPQPDLGGIPWSAFFMVSMATYGVIGAAMTWAVNISLERHSGWVRQLRTTPLPPAGYVLVKVLVTLLAAVPAIVCVGLAGRFVNDVQLGAGQWVGLLLVLAIGSLPFATFAVMLGYLLRPESAQPVSMLLFFGVSLLGGLFAPIDTLPDVVATIGRMLPSYRLASLGWQVVAGVPIDASDVAVLAGWAALFGAIAVLRYRADAQRPAA